MDQIPCELCEEEFDTVDSLIDHMKETHGATVELQYDLSESEAAPAAAGSPGTPQVETPLQTMVDNPESVENLIETTFNRWGEMKQEGFSHQLNLIIVVGALFLSVLIASTVLVWQGVLAGSAYTFLLGTLTGYLLTFLEDFL